MQGEDDRHPDAYPYRQIDVADAESFAHLPESHRHVPFGEEIDEDEKSSEDDCRDEHIPEIAVRRKDIRQRSGRSQEDPCYHMQFIGLEVIDQKEDQKPVHQESAYQYRSSGIFQ